MLNSPVFLLIFCDCCEICPSLLRNVCGYPGEEVGLVSSFVEVCSFLDDNPDYLSWRSRINIPSVQTQQGLEVLAEKYFLGFRRSDFPAIPGTVPVDSFAALLEILAIHQILS